MVVSMKEKRLTVSVDVPEVNGCEPSCKEVLEGVLEALAALYPEESVAQAVRDLR